MLRLSVHNRVIRRLLPLYVAAFCQGFVLWYSFEKVLMGQIGFTATTIGVMTAAYAAMVLLMETPSGILADRWSRKGVLMLAGCSLAISSLICGLSHSIPVYIVGAVFWGVFYALYSGTYDSIVYDALLEESNHADHYEKYYGYVRIMEGVALVIGSLLGGVVAAQFGLRPTFLWTVPIALVSVAALAFLKEPKLHKADTSEAILLHIKNTFRSVVGKPGLKNILIIQILGALTSEIILEFSQLWWIATHAPVGIFGITGAVLLSVFAISGFLAARLPLEKRGFVLGFSALLLASGGLLITSRNVWWNVAAQSIIVVAVLAVDIIYLKRLHDHLPSKVRAGAASAVSTLGKALFMLSAVVFGWLAQRTDIFTASWFLIGPLIMLCILLYTEAHTGTTKTVTDDRALVPHR